MNRTGFKHEYFLTEHEGHGVTVVYRNGLKIKGILRGVDQYSVLIDTGVNHHIIFKHEIAEILIERRKKRPLEEAELRELLSWPPKKG